MDRLIRFTAWLLTDRRGAASQCVISERNGYWHVEVSHDAKPVMFERCKTDDAAFARAIEIWKAFTEKGWTEAQH